jgi:hypothetical protein
MGSKIRIETDGQLERGKKNSVRVIVHFDKETKVRGIRALIHGAERTEAQYTETQTDSEGKTKTVMRTAVEHHDILREKILLHGEERMGFFSRIGDSMATWVGGGKHEVLGPGELEFMLNVDIPENAPGSFKGKKCSVYYKVDLSVDLPIRVDWSESVELELATKAPDRSESAPVHVTFPDEDGRSFWDKTFGKPVKLNLAIDRDVIGSSEKALAMLAVESPEPLKVKKIAINLIGTESSWAHGHQDQHIHNMPLGEVDSPAVIAQEAVEEFEILIPDIDGLTTRSGKNYSINWKVQVQLHIPWAKDPIIEVPIRIV